MIAWAPALSTHDEADACINSTIANFGAVNVGGSHRQSTFQTAEQIEDRTAFDCKLICNDCSRPDSPIRRGSGARFKSDDEDEGHADPQNHGCPTNSKKA
jgi:hypothetical protein